MADFSTRALSIQPTGVRKMFDMAQEESIHLGLGEPDFQPPRVAIDAFHAAMVDGRNKYTSTAGLPALREAIAATWHHLEPDLTAEHVCMTMSGTNALLNVFMATLDPGTNMLLPDPHFPLYGPDVRLCGAEERYYPCTFEHEFVPTIESLEALVDENTRGIVYNFPSNPTGATITTEQRDALVDFARRHDLWIITDEVYDRIVYDGEHVSFLGTGYAKTIMINSFSKTFAMTGWRVGYVLSANPAAMEQVMKLQYYITACSNDGLQYGVLAAMEEAGDYPQQMCDQFQRRRDLIVTRLNAMPGVECHSPQGAFYVFPKVDVPGISSADLAVEILKAGVVCSPGSAFGPSGEGHLRFAYTNTYENIERAMDLVEGVLKRLLASPEAA